MAQASLTAKGLCYAYPDGTRALRGIDLVLNHKERVGLIGPNGSGKSTLLLCLSGLIAGEGRIELNGQHPGPAGLHELRGRVGLVFQSPDDQLFMPTLHDDLAFGPINQGLTGDQVSERVQRVAADLGLSGMLERAPHHLSMGQKRNAAIACVLAMRPAVVLLDEPSSNLDPRARRTLMNVLAPLEAALLIASHDLALVAALCPRVVLLDEGQIVADGPAGAILSNAALMETHGLEVWPPP